MGNAQYALVKNGALVLENDEPVISGFMSSPPDDYSSRFPEGCSWLRIQDEDSREFSVAHDARLPPVFEINGSVVKRKFEIKRVRR